MPILLCVSMSIFSLDCLVLYPEMYSTIAMTDLARQLVATSARGYVLQPLETACAGSRSVGRSPDACNDAAVLLIRAACHLCIR